MCTNFHNVIFAYFFGKIMITSVLLVTTYNNTFRREYTNILMIMCSKAVNDDMIKIKAQNVTFYHRNPQ